MNGEILEKIVYNNTKEKVKHRHTRKSKIKYQKHLKALASKPGYKPSGAYYKTHWSDETYVPRYVRLYRCQRSKQIKKNCNRMLRRRNKNSEELLQRGSYRKATEFWWEYD